jgi:TadE-like protein
MMGWFGRRERGQSTLEMGILIGVAGFPLLLLSAGLFDVSRMFYQYNAVSAAARYGARWASVVGGTCSTQTATQYNGSGNLADWCNQQNNANQTAGSVSGDFWSLNGNRPLQSAPTQCPSGIDNSFTGYYHVSDYQGINDTSVIGAIAHRFDTTGSSPSSEIGGVSPGFDMSQMLACIQPSAVCSTTAQGACTSYNWEFGPGTILKVYVYYPFKPVTPLVHDMQNGNFSVTLVAASQSIVE